MATETLLSLSSPGRCVYCGQITIRLLSGHDPCCSDCMESHNAIHCRDCHQNFLESDVKMHSVFWDQGTCDRCYIYRHEIDIGDGQTLEFKTSWEKVHVSVLVDKKTGKKKPYWWGKTKEMVKDSAGVMIAVGEIDGTIYTYEVHETTRRFPREFPPFVFEPGRGSLKTDQHLNRGDQG